jgi:quercetin dioxygenase-like cupin family protein
MSATLHPWTGIPEEQMNDRLARQALHTETMTIARLTLLKGAIVPLHHHPNEQISMVNTGRLLFRMGGRDIVVCAGEILQIPPNLPHEVICLEDSNTLDLFSPPREDWIRGDDAYLRK